MIFANDNLVGGVIVAEPPLATTVVRADTLTWRPTVTAPASPAIGAGRFGVRGREYRQRGYVVVADLARGRFGATPTVSPLGGVAHGPELWPPLRR
jgi:hypothetical protein